MAESHFLSALKQRRADYLGELQAIQASMAELEAKEAETIDILTCVDALLRKEAPDLALDSIRPRKRREPHPRSGSADDTDGRVPLTKAILKMLRTRRVPMSAREVFEAVQSEYADGNDAKLLRGISTFLSMKKKAGLLRAVQNSGEGVRYAVAA